MKGRIVLTLFALPFLGVGGWASWSIGTTLDDAWQMRDWRPVEARLLSAGYETTSGDDSDTYRAYATFEYSVDGRRYTGDRVAITGGADNIGDFQTDLGQRLSRAQSRGETVTVFVNPDDPADAVADRTLRWGLVGFKALFLVVFGGVGVGVLYAAYRRAAADKTPDPSVEAEPWRLNDQWKAAGIRSGSRGAMRGAWLFAAIWNLISAPLPLVAYREVVQNDNTVALVALLFPLIGVGLLVHAIRQTLEWRRFGPALVALDPFPGGIGGHVGGTIDLRLPFDPGAEFRMTLTCLHSYVSGSGKDRRRRESAKWQDARLAHSEPGGPGTRLSFRFDVPAHLDDADAARDNDDYHLWRLNLNAALPGTDLDRDYDIPVYRTAARSRHLPERVLAMAQEKQSRYAARSLGERFRYDQSAAGRRLLFPMGRYLGPSLSGFVIGALFAGAGGYLVVHEGSTIFGSVFGGVGALIAIACLYAMLNSLEVRQEAAGIVSIRRLLGVPIRRRHMQRHEFAHFLTESSSQVQSGNKHVMHYTVRAVDRHGNRLVLGEGFRGESEAHAAEAFLAREFGLRARDTAPRDENGAGDGDGNVLAADR